MKSLFHSGARGRCFGNCFVKNFKMQNLRITRTSRLLRARSTLTPVTSAMLLVDVWVLEIQEELAASPPLDGAISSVGRS